MSTSMLTILAVIAVFLAYALVAPLVANIGRFFGRTWLYCPERQEYALVGVNTLAASLSAGYGAPDIAVRRCSLRKPGEVCDERCLNGADF